MGDGENTLYPSTIKTKIASSNYVHNGAQCDIMCQIDWAIGLPDIWADDILGVPSKVCWMKFTFKPLG
jgi:hypothetical protein